MVKAVALNTIHLCKKTGVRRTPTTDAVPAIVEEIAPGSVFDVSQAQFNELAASGSARLASRTDLAVAGSDATAMAIEDAEKAVKTAEAARTAARTDAEKTATEADLQTAKGKLAELTRA